MEPLSKSLTLENFKDRFPNLSDKEYPGHRKRIYSLSWNCTGNKLGTGSGDTTIRVFYLGGLNIFLDMEPRGCNF